MVDSDEDAPPALDSLAQQLDALRLRQSGAPGAAKPSQPAQQPGTATPPSACLAQQPAAFAQPPTMVPQAKAKAKALPPAIKRGFFDQKPKKRAAQPKPAKEAAAEVIEEIPMLKAKPCGIGSGPQIPDFMHLPPDAQAKQYAQFKEKIVDALKPTQDTMQSVLGNQELLAGFDDPEVMAAVADVSANPKNMKKYQNSPKVIAFYKQMGSVMAARCDQLAAQQEAKVSA
ncbi:hypothetical protein WJX72_003346 [[Myrmecia] bisecta]|uniref:STI1 domain-containing protein n=1 Tax=[Myrmecia] bisecta TaxID=41462 RepID=A0AAW1QPW8_9CHLO